MIKEPQLERLLYNDASNAKAQRARESRMWKTLACACKASAQTGGTPVSPVASVPDAPANTPDAGVATAAPAFVSGIGPGATPLEDASGKSDVALVTPRFCLFMACRMGACCAHELFGTGEEGF